MNRLTNTIAMGAASMLLLSAASCVQSDGAKDNA